MNTKLAARRLADAEAKLAGALRRLHALQRAAVLGHGNSEALDEAVLAYRQARGEAAAARLVWEDRRAAHAEPDDPAPPRAEEPSPRLLFARWLAETGRLSESRAA